MCFCCSGVLFMYLFCALYMCREGLFFVGCYRIMYLIHTLWVRRSRKVHPPTPLHPPPPRWGRQKINNLPCIWLWVSAYLQTIHNGVLGLQRKAGMGRLFLLKIKRFIFCFGLFLLSFLHTLILAQKQEAHPVGLHGGKIYFCVTHTNLESHFPSASAHLVKVFSLPVFAWPSG